MRNTFLANRLADIILLAHSGQPLKIQELAERYSVCTKTIRRDLDRLGTALDRCPITGTYRLTSTSTHVFNEHDLVSLIDRLGLKKALPHKTARFLINFVNQNTGGCYHFQEAPLEMDFIESLHTLIEKAIQSKREVQFLYKNKTRKVNPYMMVFYRGSWYLAATAEGVLKAFSLARIKLASLGNEHFAIDEAIIKQIKEHDSVWFGQPEFEVTLEVHPDVAFFFERKALLPRQEILEKKPDGTLIIRACAWSYSQIVPLVQSWIPNIKVISPRKLHQHIQQNFTQWLASSGNISD